MKPSEQPLTIDTQNTPYVILVVGVNGVGKTTTIGKVAHEYINKGKKVMLSFYRYAACPLCNLRVNDLINHYPDFNNKGLEMIAIFQSPTKSILKFGSLTQ